MGKNFIGRQNDRQRGGREAVDSLILGDFGKGDKKFREIGNSTKKRVGPASNSFRFIVFTL